MPDTLALYENIWLCRNRLLTGILKLCKENVGRIPKIIGMDVVEMALWAQVLLLASSLYVNAIVSTSEIFGCLLWSNMYTSYSLYSQRFKSIRTIWTHICVMNLLWIHQALDIYSCCLKSIHNNVDS